MKSRPYLSVIASSSITNKMFFLFFTRLPLNNRTVRWPLTNSGHLAEYLLVNKHYLLLTTYSRMINHKPCKYERYAITIRLRVLLGIIYK